MKPDIIANPLAERVNQLERLVARKDMDIANLLMENARLRLQLLPPEPVQEAPRLEAVKGK